MTTFGLLIFDGAEELDVVGPWEVFTASAMIQAGASAAANTCVTVAEKPGLVRCAKGLHILPDHSFADHPPLDVLLVPGGAGAHGGVTNAALIGWIRDTAAKASWVTSVCTGAALLHEAGPGETRGHPPCLRGCPCRPGRGHGRAGRPVRRRRQPRHQPGRLRGYRHGPMARRPHQRPHARARGTPVHPVRPGAALPRRRAAHLTSTTWQRAQR